MTKREYVVVAVAVALVLVAFVAALLGWWALSVLGLGGLGVLTLGLQLLARRRPTAVAQQARPATAGAAPVAGDLEARMDALAAQVTSGLGDTRAEVFQLRSELARLRTDERDTAAVLPDIPSLPS